MLIIYPIESMGLVYLPTNLQKKIHTNLTLKCADQNLEVAPGFAPHYTGILDTHIAS